MKTCSTEFWQRHRGLVWSNPDADDGVFIRAALVRPRFGRLLDIALEFGLDRIRHEWKYLQQDKSLEVERARAIVERILANIATGFLKAEMDGVRKKIAGNSTCHKGKRRLPSGPQLG